MKNCKMCKIIYGKNRICPYQEKVATKIKFKVWAVINTDRNWIIESNDDRFFADAIFPTKKLATIYYKQFHIADKSGIRCREDLKVVPCEIKLLK